MAKRAFNIVSLVGKKNVVLLIKSQLTLYVGCFPNEIDCLLSSFWKELSSLLFEFDQYTPLCIDETSDKN